MKIIKMSKDQNIKDFIKRWVNRGAERQNTQTFWLELLSIVLGVELPGEMIEFEKKVDLEHNSFIDAYIPLTRVLIEQKSKNTPLDKVISQSDKNQLTPYQQAKRYSDWLLLSQHARWIVTCNFQEFWVYNMETPKAEPEIIQLKNLYEEWPKLKFLIASAEGKQEENESADFMFDTLFYVKTVKLKFKEHCRFVLRSSTTPIINNRRECPS